jgi:aminopeptidase N
MKKKRSKTEDDDDLSPEYDFSKMKLVGRGIYAERYRSGTNLVLLDRDVRKAFPDDKLVNEALRMIARIAKEQTTVSRKLRARKQPSRSRRAA